MDPVKRPKKVSVKDLTGKEAKAILLEVVISVRAGRKAGSSADIGDMVVADLEKAGVRL